MWCNEGGWKINVKPKYLQKPGVSTWTSVQEPNDTMTWIIKQRVCQSGKNRISYDVSYGSTSYSNISKFKSIYMDLQTTICIGIVPSIHTNTIQLSWNRTSLLFSPAGVLITLWLANEFEFKALKEILVLKKKSIGIRTLISEVLIKSHPLNLVCINCWTIQELLKPQFVMKSHDSFKTA